MTDGRSNDPGFNEIAIRTTVWVLVWAGLIVVDLVACIVYAPNTPWVLIAIVLILGAGLTLWTVMISRRRRELDQQPTPICCPKCRFLTATPSGFCPRCGETIPSQRCRRCGYDLRGNTTGACSECGMEWDLPEGTFRCTWTDCLRPNPTGALTCRHCGREIAPSDPLPEKERRFVRRFLL